MSESVNVICFAPLVSTCFFGQMFYFLWNRILYLCLGYSYISIAKERDSHQAVPNYRPEIGDAIWNGLISIDPLFPLGDGWQDFAKRVIDGAQHPMWQPYPHLPTSAPIDSVTPSSGMIMMTWVLRINGYLISSTPISHIFWEIVSRYQIDIRIDNHSKDRI